MFWLIIASCLVVDQASKLLVLSTMNLGESIVLIDNVFNITYYLNNGAAFSFLEGKRWLFIVITVLVVLVVLYVTRHIPRNYRLLRAMIALFIGGTLGNFIDRVVRGAVVDFFNVPFFAIFNVADCCLTVSVIVICILMLFGREKHLLEGKNHE